MADGALCRADQTHTLTAAYLHYDTLGRLDRMTNGFGLIVDYDYDAAGRPVARLSARRAFTTPTTRRQITNSSLPGRHEHPPRFAVAPTMLLDDVTQ